MRIKNMSGGAVAKVVLTPADAFAIGLCEKEGEGFASYVPRLPSPNFRELQRSNFPLQFSDMPEVNKYKINSYIRTHTHARARSRTHTHTHSERGGVIFIYIMTYNWECEKGKQGHLNRM